MDDPDKNSIMNQLLRDYSQYTQEPSGALVPPVPPSHTKLEKVTEQPDEEEEEFDNSRPLNSEDRPLTKLMIHHKGVSDSSSASRRTQRKSAAQQLFKQELQRRCESLIITSHKLISDDEGAMKSQDLGEECPSYTELVESRNAVVAQSSVVGSGSTRDSMQEQDETYDVLASIQASQKRQDDENANYIVDTLYDEEGDVAVVNEDTFESKPEIDLEEYKNDAPVLSPARYSKVHTAPISIIAQENTSANGLF